MWNAETGKELLTLSGHTNAVRSVAWNPDGKRLVDLRVTMSRTRQRIGICRRLP